MIDNNQQTCLFQFSLSRENYPYEWKKFHDAARLILANSKTIQFDERPGKTYLMFSENTNHPSVNEAFITVCNSYQLNHNEIIRKAAMENCYEIKGIFIELFSLNFPYPTQKSIINANRKTDYHIHGFNSAVLQTGEAKCYESRPGNLYLDFTRSKYNDKSIVNAFGTICYFYGLSQDHFCQTSQDRLFQISEPLFKLFSEEFPIDKPIIARHSA